MLQVMSEETNTNNLKCLSDFRYQHKSFTHAPVKSASNNDCNPKKQVVKRRRILPIADSGSESNDSQSTIIMSDCEIIEVGDTEDVEIVSVTSSTSATAAQTGFSPIKAEQTDVNLKVNNTGPTYYNANRFRKSDAVLEKEKQMRFLREKYPSMESMTIHDVLSKHNFHIENAVKHIELMLNDKEKKCKVGNFKEWKMQLEKKVQQNSQTPVTQSVSLNAAVRKRNNVGEFSNSTIKKAKRMRTDAPSDESDSETANYKDNRVFDSDEDSDIELSNELTKDKRKVFNFFEKATENELQLMQTCSKKKVEAIIECRPFKNWIDLIEKLQENKNLSTDLLNFANQVLVTRRNIQALMKKCKNLALQLERAVLAGAGVKHQPTTLNPERHLTKYQLEGLNWLAVLNQQGVNGILADEMGLGKTVQVIAFLAHLKEKGLKKGKPHLIVVPSSTLENWRLEFEGWCPDLKVFMYYGTTEERKMYRIEYFHKGLISEYDVILTTYAMLTNTSEERKMFRVTEMDYLVFDEAHMLKNMNTQRYENLIRVKGTNRILLTGTPLQNNLLELMSLLIFVMPTMFAGKADDIKNLFQKNSKAAKKNGEEDLPKFERKQINHAKEIMKPFVLRRLKCDVLQDLPQKTDELVIVPMVETQLDQYKNLVFYYQNNAQNPTVDGKYSAMTIMSDLRKLSNHPLLLKRYYQNEDVAGMAKILASDPSYKDTVVDYIQNDLDFMSDFEVHTLCGQYPSISKYRLPDSLLVTSGKFAFFDEKLEELKQGGHRVLIFSQYVIMLNIMEEYLRIRNHSYLRLDGSTPVIIRQELINQFSSDPSIFIFLLSTRAGGLGINLTAADTVIINDIDFNPYNDKQAEDRCHRLGQTRPVSVIRLISEGTIEEGIWQMNKEKLKLEREVTANESENEDKSVVRLLSSVLGIDHSVINGNSTPIVVSG